MVAAVVVCKSLEGQASIGPRGACFHLPSDPEPKLLSILFPFNKHPYPFLKKHTDYVSSDSRWKHLAAPAGRFFPAAARTWRPAALPWLMQVLGCSLTALRELPGCGPADLGSTSRFPNTKKLWGYEWSV